MWFAIVDFLISALCAIVVAILVACVYRIVQIVMLLRRELGKLEDDLVKRIKNK